MLRNAAILYCFFLSIVLFQSFQPIALAEDGKVLASHLSLGMGWERLDYEEQEPHSGVQSNATVDNAIVGIEGLKRWDSVWGGIRATIPVVRDQGEEKWTASDTAKFQTNNLNYGWMRIDGYIGYPSPTFLSPYGGVRWSESRQDRSNFFVNNAAVAGCAKETIRSWNVLLGVRGDGNFTPHWRWNYRINYVIPVDVRVTNSALPGFVASEKEGYTVELHGAVDYSFTKTLSFGIQFYGGRMQWNGSDWTASSSGWVKWPENKTDFLGSLLNFRWHP